MSRNPTLYAFPLFSAPVPGAPSLLPVAWLHATPGEAQPAMFGPLLAVARPDALSGQPVTTAFRPDERRPSWTAPDLIDGSRCAPLGDMTLHADAHGDLLTRNASGEALHRTRLPGGMDIALHLPFLTVGDVLQPDQVIVPSADTLVGYRAPQAAAWTWTAPGPLQALAVDGHVVYAATANQLTAVDARCGHALWHQPLPGSGRVHLSAHRERVFVARDGGQIHAFTAAGDAAWHRAPGGTPLTVFHAGADLLLIAVGGNAQLTAIDAATGLNRWTFAGEQPCTSALINGNVVYAACGRLHALCADTGHGVALSGLFPHIPGHISTPHLTLDPARQLMIAWASAVPAAHRAQHAS